MRKKENSKQRLFTGLFFAFFTFMAQAQTMPDPLPQAAKKHKASTTPEAIQTPEPTDTLQDIVCLELTIENLLAVIDRYGLQHKEIVAAQAILETGNFTSQVCKEKNNLFGLRRPGDGSYFEFPNWEESVRAYRDDVQYKYSGGDYYAFLNRIGYAEDRRYTAKVRRIEKRLSPAMTLMASED